ncbi:MAG: hypothetical protein J7M34_10415 [Anaerolineae bacterium]|nr:hypothetical protein [Anaerolineae bacterium]
MFLSQEMAEVEIIVPERDMLAVTSVLAGQGVFQEIDASYLRSETEAKEVTDWRGRVAAYATLERRVLAIIRALGADEGQPPLSNTASMTEIETIRPAVDQLEAETQKVLNDLTDSQRKLQQLQGHLRQLAIIAGLEVDISLLREPRFIFSMLGIMPASHIKRLQTSLVRIPFLLLTLHEDNQQAVVWLLGTQQDADILRRAARSAYLNPLELPEAYQGTPAQIMEAIQADITKIEQHIQECQEELARLRGLRQQQLQELLWRIRISRMLADTIAHFGKFHYTYVIVGWVPVAKLSGLRRRLRQVSEDILIEVSPAERGEADQNVPVALHNPGLLRIFQQLVATYAWPRYDEVDPTVLIALTFPVLFGAMFGDVAHGLLLASLGALVASRKVRALHSLAGLGPLTIICGLTAAVFGILYGSVFGLEDVIPALWLHPMKNIMHLLLVTIGFGVILLNVGFFLGMFNAWLARDWSRLLFDRNGIAGFVLYWAVLGWIAEVFTGSHPVPSAVLMALVGISGLAVMFSELLKRLLEKRRPLVEGGVGTYIVQAFFELVETLIAIFSNTLSYVRVGAFAVAHGGLSAMFFILAEMVSPAHGVGYWFVIALGTLFIVGFEGLIVGIQALRLEYYEFFAKFFQGGGVRYTPLAVMPEA